jgi:chromosomal replication initiator protein
MQIGVNELWNKCLMIIKEDISEHNFNTWFTPIVPLKFSNNTLTLQVPSQFFYEWLEENYVSIFRKAIDLVIGKNGMLEYSVVIDKGDRKNPPITFNLPTNHSSQNTYNSYSDKYPNNQPSSAKNPFQFKDLDSLELDSYLIPKYTFDKFIEGDCNRLGRAAGMAVSNKPGLTSFNPLMIYGGVGLGKTHLIQAIGNQIKDQYPEKFVLYVSTEKFTNQFVNAIRNNSIETFTNFYLQVDVLIIDDVQFLSGKEKTQETFFNIFNHLHQSGKQIILSSDRAPRDLAGMEDRLLSRFKWGLTADLQQPDFETRIAIIQKKLQDDGIQINIDVLEYLANSIQTNVRELEGVIISLMAQASLTRKEIDIELAKTTLKSIVNDQEKELSVDNILDVVTLHFDVDLQTLQGKCRKKENVFPRQVAMYMLKELTNLPLKSIGYHFGGRDHSTVIHAVQSISEAMETDKSVEKTVRKLFNRFNLSSN